MAHDITVPRLGWSMEEGTFLRWLKQDGQSVRAGEALFELEGEKATQDVEAVDSGILNVPAGAPAPGTVVPVGAVLGYLLQPGEAPPGGKSPAASPASSAAASQPVASPPAPPPAVAPSVRRRAREMGVDLATVVGSARSGRITAEDLQSAVKPSPPLRVATKVVASPRARRVATELGIDWKQLTGTGSEGRIRESDVRAAAAQGASSSRSSITLSGGMTARRRTIAQRMRHSHQQVVPVTLTSQADATNLVNLRTQFKFTGNTVVPAYTDILAKLVAATLQQHPALAACWQNDDLLPPREIDLGLAVDTSEGLLVPVIRNVPQISLVDLARQTRDLAQRAREGKLTAAEMQGGVFTITSLGAFGIDAFTPIINYPQTAILGVGAIRRVPAVHAGEIVPRDLITFSLTFDHRAVDGAPAARFLQAVGLAVENPSAALLSGF